MYIVIDGKRNKICKDTYNNIIRKSGFIDKSQIIIISKDEFSNNTQEGDPLEKGASLI